MTTTPTADPNKVVNSGPLIQTGAPTSMAGVNLSGALSKNNPLPGQNYFDPSVDSRLIPEQQNRDFKGLLNYGVGKDDVGGTGGAGFASGTDAMATALSNRYQGQAKTAIQSVTDKNAATALTDASGNEATISKELAAERSNDVQNFNAQYAYQVQRQNLYNQWQTAIQQQQSAIYGSIFGGIGKLGGAVVAGAVGGAI